MKKNINDKNRNLYDFDLENEKTKDKKKSGYAKNKKSKHSKVTPKEIEREAKAKQKEIEQREKKIQKEAEQRRTAKQKEIQQKEKQKKKIIEQNEKRKELKAKAEKKTKEKTASKVDSDNEIIIGVTRYPEPSKVENKKKKKSKKEQPHNKGKQINNKKGNPVEKGLVKSKQLNEFENVKKTKKNKNIKKVLKWTSLIVIVIGIVVFAMLSPIFNIEKIAVSGNSVVTAEELISLSGVETGENIFRINKKEIQKSIKQNGYVENVTIKRKLPSTIEISIEERQASFMIQYGSGYVYINNQGYILEINNAKKQIPILSGVETPNEQFVEANRLNETDLKKLGTVLKIMSVAQVNDIAELITTIDISDDSDYKLYFDAEKKQAYLGDCSDLETRMLYLTAILKNEAGKAGEIFVNMNLNVENAFFRESV